MSDFPDAADYVDGVERERYFLVTERDSKRLLADWANQTRGNTPEADARRLLDRWPKFFACLPGNENVAGKRKSKTVDPEHLTAIMRTQYLIRRAWDAPNTEIRNWFIYKARDEWNQWTAVKRAPVFPGSTLSDAEFRLRTDPPNMTAFDAVAGYFQRLAPHARHCANPACPAPLFFSSKKNQRYCSSQCTAPAQREHKRRWWAKHGSKMSKRRKH